MFVILECFDHTLPTQAVKFNDCTLLSIATYFITVFSLFCPEQLCDEITRHGYYMIKKVPTLSGNMLRTSLDRGIPLIICSSEYELSREVPELLRTPTIPDNWNILYLHQNDDGNNLQWNERVEVIRIDLNNGRPVVDWLCTKLPRRSSTSVDGRQQGLLSETELIFNNLISSL